MMIRDVVRAIVFSGVACAVAAAGPLDPPAGPVAPTLKTLEQVEPRTPINADTTPGDADSVFKITAPGSYYLTEGFDVPSGFIGIEIAANEVAVDLNGFRILGEPGSLAGVGVTAFSPGRHVVRNGFIAGMGGDGVNLGLGAHSVVAGVVARDCGGVGFNLIGAGSRIERCSAVNNTGDGFFFLANAIATDCDATQNDNGFVRSTIVDGGTLSLTRCTARNNGQDGFVLESAAVLRDCTSAMNGSEGFTGSGPGPRLLVGCTSVNDTGEGFDLQSASLVRCGAQGSGSSGLAGFLVSNCVLEACIAQDCLIGGFRGTECTLSGCMALDNGDRGFDLTSSDLVRCLAARNADEGFSVVGSTLSACTSTNNRFGFILSGCTAEGCDAGGNTESGFSLAFQSIARGCTSGGNGDRGFGLSFGSLAEGCTSMQNAGHGFYVFDSSRVVGCLSSEHTMSTQTQPGGAGFRTEGESSHLEGNTAIGNNVGFQILGTGNLVIGNRASANVNTDYAPGAGNSVGTITNLAGSTLGTDNLTY